MRKNRRILALCVVALLVLVLGSVAEAARLTVLHVNDTHGHAWPFDLYNNPGVGGFAPLATLIQEIRQEVEAQGGHVLLLHAGDFNTGVPESDQNDAMPDIVAMNMLRFDAVGLGNHEFDKPREVLDRQGRFLDCPLVNANILTGEGKQAFAPYILKDFGDVKVGVYGLTTEETTKLEPTYLGDWKFENAIETSKRIVPELKKSADVVIALAHLGWAEAPAAGYTTSKMLAEASVPGLDIIVDGHSHTLFEQPPLIDTTMVVSAGEWTQYLGRLDLVVEQGAIVGREWRLIPINAKTVTGKDAEGKDVLGFVDKEIPADREVEAALGYFLKIGAEKLALVVGETKVLLDGERNNVRARDTNLSNMVADSMRWKTGADIALMNGGGVRASIQPGPISYRDILTVMPFGNTLYVMEVTGEEIQKLLDFVVTIPEGKGGWPHFSNLTFAAKDGKGVDAKVGGEPLDPKRSYKMVTINYLAMGGDGYEVFRDAVARGGYDTGFVDAAAFQEFLADQKVIENWDDSQRYVR